MIEAEILRIRGGDSLIVNANIAKIEKAGCFKAKLAKIEKYWKMTLSNNYA